MLAFDLRKTALDFSKRFGIYWSIGQFGMLFFDQIDEVKTHAMSFLDLELVARLRQFPELAIGQDLC